jgi:hypothetical protein
LALIELTFGLTRNQPFIEVSMKGLWETRGIDEELKESSSNRSTPQVLETIHPRVTGAVVNQDQAMCVTLGGLAISITDIHVDILKVLGGARTGAAMATTRNSVHITQLHRRCTGVDDLEVRC